MADAGGVLRLTAPSKSFFLGEYLALVGGRTLLAATLPRFELQAIPGSGAVRGVAPTSPAGRLIAAHATVFCTVDLEFTDPHAGAGGWGASAAQFLLCYAALERIRDRAARALSPSPRIDVERILSAYVDLAWVDAAIRHSARISSPSSKAESSSSPRPTGSCADMSGRSTIWNSSSWPPETKLRRTSI